MKTVAEITAYFQANYPKAVRKMKESDHHYSEGGVIYPNPYHLEGDVHTHTQMVLREAEKANASVEVIWACLLHDIGKPDSREEVSDRKRARFIGHEGLSVYQSISILKNAGLSDQSIILILNMISLHSDLFDVAEKGLDDFATKYQGNKNLAEQLSYLVSCDMLGRFMALEKEPTVLTRQDFLKTMKEWVQLIEPIPFVNPNKPVVTLLIGPPCAGKSTYLVKNLQGQKVFSRDQVIMELGEGKNYTDAYHSVDMNKVDHVFNSQLREAGQGSESVVIDMTAMSPKGRRRLLGSFSDKTFTKKAVVFYTDYDLLLKRNRKRMDETGKFIPEKVIKQMCQNFTTPTFVEFDLIEYVIQG